MIRSMGRREASGSLHRDGVASLDDAVFCVHVDQVRFVQGQLEFVVLPVGGNDDDVGGNAGI